MGRSNIMCAKSRSPDVTNLRKCRIFWVRLTDDLWGNVSYCRRLRRSTTRLTVAYDVGIKHRRLLLFISHFDFTWSRQWHFLVCLLFCCREFYYIQMEKYARQALAEGIKNASNLIVTTDSELYRVLVLHYNRNNQIEVCRLVCDILQLSVVYILHIAYCTCVAYCYQIV